MPLVDPWDLISSAVDLDDLAEHKNAHHFMVSALARVTECLPLAAQSAPFIAKQYLDGVASADDVLAVRVALWESIRGRDLTDEPDVLRIRTTICALYGMDYQAPYETLEYFLMFWEQSGLSMDELEKAILDSYGVVHIPRKSSPARL